MGSPLRIEDGISDRTSDSPFGSFPYLDPTKWAVYMEDFLMPHWTKATVNNSTKTAMNCGYQVICTTKATLSIGTDAGDEVGCLSIVTEASDNKGVGLHPQTPAMAMQVGKKFIMQTSFEATVAAIAQCELFIGLATIQTGATFFATDGLSMTADDRVGWVSYDGTAPINITCGEADVVEEVTAIVLPVTGTWYKLTMYYDGADLHYYNGTTKTGVVSLGDKLPVSVVGPAIWFKSGSAAVCKLLVDYLFVARER